MKANPSRRPDIFPDFKPQKTQLPKPLPGDPEVPDDEGTFEKERKRCAAELQPFCQASMSRLCRPKPGVVPEKEPEEEEEEEVRAGCEQEATLLTGHAGS